MSEILTAENIATLLLEVVDSHKDLREKLAEARADVRALAGAAMLFLEWCQYGAAWKELAAIDKAQEALARPGVQRIMEEQDAHHS